MSGRAAQYHILRCSNGKPWCSPELTAMVHKIKVSAVKLHFVSPDCGSTWLTECDFYTITHTLSEHALNAWGHTGKWCSQWIWKSTKTIFFFLFFDCFLGWHTWMLNTWRGTKIHTLSLSLPLSHTHTGTHAHRHTHWELCCLGLDPVLIRTDGQQPKSLPWLLPHHSCPVNNWLHCNPCIFKLSFTFQWPHPFIPWVRIVHICINTWNALIACVIAQ